VPLFYGVLDTSTGNLRYSCAGHNPPLLYRPSEDRFQELKTPGIAMGVLEEIQLGEAEIQLEIGDCLVCYTDGVTEAINLVEEQFGVPRLREVIRTHYQQNANELQNAITDAVSLFTSGQPPFDDVTLVVIKRVG
jgi:serine phosphatase RsbU (regulator of sigma subunit)